MKRRYARSQTLPSADLVESIYLATRVRNALAMLGIRTIDELLDMNPAKILDVRGYGAGAFAMLTRTQECVRRLKELESLEADRNGRRSGAGKRRSSPAQLRGRESSHAQHAVAYDEAVMMLGCRARHTLERLGVTSMESLRSVSQERVFRLKSCGIRTWLEIWDLQRTLGLISEESPSDAKDSVAHEDLLTNQPVTTDALLETPLFSSREVPIPTVRPYDLHPTYQADLPVDALSLPARACKVCKNLGIADLGTLLCTRSTALVAQGNCGEKTVEGIQEAVKEELLPECRHEDRAVDLISFARMVDSWVTRVSGAGRNGQVLLRRFMASGASLPTLLELGSEFGLTREGVRQIILVGQRKLCERKSLRLVEGFWRAVDAVLARAGLLMSLDDATKRISSRLGWATAPSSAQIGRIVSLNASYAVDEDRSIVYQSALPCASCKQVRSMLLELFKDGTQEMRVADAADRLAIMCMARCRAGAGRMAHHERVFVATVVPLCGGKVVLDGEVVMTEAFRQAKIPKTIRQLVSETLYAFGRPAHYSEIATAIRDRNSQSRDVTDEQVVDCLRRYDSFTRTGLGAYALAVWGHKPYKTHAQAIIELLESAREPLLRSHIMACLTRDGKYKKPNLRLALAGHSRIVKIGRDLYDLRERAAASGA